MNDYNKAIALIIPLIVKNNAGAVAISLRNEGYETKASIIPAPELEAKMFQVFMADPDRFFTMMDKISWDYGETITNTPEIKGELMALMGMDDTPETKGQWWKKLLLSVQNEYQASLAECKSQMPVKINMWPFVAALAAIVVIVIILIN